MRLRPAGCTRTEAGGGGSRPGSRPASRTEQLLCAAAGRVNSVRVEGLTVML